MLIDVENYKKYIVDKNESYDILILIVFNVDCSMLNS